MPIVGVPQSDTNKLLCAHTFKRVRQHTTKLLCAHTGEDGLTAMIKARQQSRSKEMDSILGALEEKYCKGKTSGAQTSKKKARKKGG